MDNDGHWGHGTVLDTIKIEDPKRYEEIMERNSRFASSSKINDIVEKAFKDTEEKTEKEKVDMYYGYRGTETEDSGNY